MKVRTAEIWNANLSTNVRSVLYYMVNIAEPDRDLFNILADNFAEIEKYNFRVDEASIMKREAGIEITAISSRNLGYKTIVLFTICEKCGRKSLPNSKNAAFHRLNCPYQIVVDIMES